MFVLSCVFFSGAALSGKKRRPFLSTTMPPQSPALSSHKALGRRTVDILRKVMLASAFAVNLLVKGGSGKDLVYYLCYSG